MKVSKLIVRSSVIGIVALICVFVCLYCTVVGECYSAETLKEKDVADILKRLNLKVISEPTSTYAFCAFDANTYGEYIIGIDQNNADMVLAFDSNTDYLFGFSFNNNGSFGVMWEDEYVVLYPSRSDLAVVVDRNGACLRIDKLERSIENDEHRSKVIFANRREIGNTCYIAENGILDSEYLHWGTYRNLVKSVPNEDDIILYASGSEDISGWFICTICVFLAMTAFLFVRKSSSRT